MTEQIEVAKDTEEDVNLGEEWTKDFIRMFEKSLVESGYIFDEFTGTWKKSF